MKKRNQKIKVGISTEEKINKEFIGAWKKAEKGKSFKIKERIYFLNATTLLKVLSDQRLILLTVLKEGGSTSIRALSRKLHRNYRNVYDDVRLLAKTGLLHQDPNKTFCVPWDKIQAEINLAA